MQEKDDEIDGSRNRKSKEIIFNEADEMMLGSGGGERASEAIKATSTKPSASKGKGRRRSSVIATQGLNLGNSDAASGQSLGNQDGLGRPSSSRITNFTQSRRPSLLNAGRRPSFLSSVTPVRSSFVGGLPSSMGAGSDDSSGLERPKSSGSSSLPSASRKSSLLPTSEEDDIIQDILDSATGPPRSLNTRKSLASRLSITAEQRRKSTLIKDKTKPPILTRELTGKERMEMKQAAQNRWKMLKIQMGQGFFKVVRKEVVDLSDFANAVEILWKDLFAYSPSGIQESEFDTSLNFLRDSAAEQFNRSEHSKHRRKVVVNYLSGTAKSKDQSQTHPSARKVTHYQPDAFSREWGYKGLSYDTTPNMDINNRLFALSRGLQSLSNPSTAPAIPSSTSPTFQDPSVVSSSVANSVQDQILQNRAWKLLLVGLYQADAFTRYETMNDIARALPCLLDNLHDPVARDEMLDMLVTLSLADERFENRVKAVYLLGRVAVALASSEECQKSLQKIFHHLAQSILRLQVSRSLASDASSISSNDSKMRIHLFRSFGKFASVKLLHAHVQESIVILLLFKESEWIFAHGAYSDPQQTDMFVLLSILETLNTSIVPNSENRPFIGALFQEFVEKIMDGQTHIECKKLSINFISKWLPITSEEAILIGLDCLVSGLDHCKSLFHNVLSEPTYHTWMTGFQSRLHSEEFNTSLRAKLMRTLIQVPGTVSNMLPLPGYPGFFCDIHSNMRKTESLLLELPIHGKSNVTLTRPIPPIPGVPSGTTTTPPLFVIGGESWRDSRPHPKSKYEYNERIGMVPELPSGFTSNPFGVIMSQQRDELSDTEDGQDQMYKVKRNSQSWVNSDEIPKGTTRIPPRSDLSSQEGDRPATSSMINSSVSGGFTSVPTGFTINCPYAGFDPDKIDHSSAPLSAIYGRSSGSTRPVSREFTNPAAALFADKGQYQDYACIGATFADKDSYVCPNGFTLNRHTPLYPCKLPGITQTEPNRDFLIGAPVIIDIIQPQRPQLQRVFCQVHSFEEDSSAIVVQRSLNDVGGMYPGSIFNLYIKPKEEDVHSGSRPASLPGTPDLSKWITVQLKVIDDNYDDGLDFSNPNQVHPLESKRKKVSQAVKKPDFFPSLAEIVPFPYPVAYTTTGEPFFAPPVHMPSFPSGYNKCGFPLYGRSPSIKPVPLGVTANGTRFYAPVKTDVSLPKNQIGGYDTDGHPFYVPRGFTLPQPSGFTVDGIPFYDIPSLIRQQGEFALPSLLSSAYRKTPSETDTWQDKLHFFQTVSDPANRRFELIFQHQLMNHLTKCVPSLRKRLTRARNRLLNPFQSEIIANKKYVFTPPSDFSVADPKNISEFLRKGICFSHLKPHLIRLMLEPATSDFQSNRAPVIKSVALRHKASRGDHTERDFYLAVEPPGVFSIKEFQMTLQGEGFQEISVSYYPMAMKTPVVNGGLHVFDRHGKRMFSANLIASRKSFFRATPVTLDMGWVVLNKTKELFLSIENLADFQFNVSLQMNSSQPLKTNPFSFPTDSVTIRPQETVKVPVLFKPTELGRVVIPLKLVGPGGEESLVVLQGTTDIPMSILPETSEFSALGISTLSRDRSAFVRKVNQMGDRDILSDYEKVLLGKISSSQNDPIARKRNHIMEFGICLPSEKTAVRCITIMNWGATPITCGIYSCDKCIVCPRVVKVAPNSATSFEVSFSYFYSKIKGNYTSVLDISCQDLDNIIVPIQAYVGQPVYMPVYENIFFPPARIEQAVYIPTSIVNDSFYTITCFFDGLDTDDTEEPLGFQLLEGATSASTPMTIPPFSTSLLTFVFKPNRAGVVSQEIGLRLVSPSFVRLPLVMREKELTLYGICLQVRNTSADDGRPRFAKKLLHWLSQTKSLKSGLEEVAEDHDTENFLTLPYNHTANVSFKNEVFIPEITADFNAIPQILATQNKSDDAFKIQYFTSPYLTVEPKSKTVEAGELTKLDLYFTPPPNASNLTTMHGFVSAMEQSTTNSHSIQVVKRMGIGFLVLPFINYSEGQVVFDFGKIELTGEGNSESVRYLILSNPFNNKYSWSIKLSPSSKKSPVFIFSSLHGELEKMDTFTIAITFKTDVSGAFESKCEIFADPPDQLAKSIRMGTVVLKGMAVSTVLTGLPEAVDFGSTIVQRSAVKKVNLQNEGTQEIEVLILVKPPFFASPHKFVIPAKSNQFFDISFNPQEHKRVAAKMQVFANQKLFTVFLSGLGGNAELVCEEFQEDVLNFGLLSDGSIAFADIYLTNKGTIPLRVASIFSETPTKLRLVFKGITSIRLRREGSTKIHVRKDHWRTVKKMVKSFRFFPNERLSNFRKFNVQQSSTGLSHYASTSKLVQITDFENLDLTVNSSAGLPVLPALSSYHFRIGYPVSYFEERHREITFSYLPLSDDSEMMVGEDLMASTTLEMTGDVYIPLDISPYSLNFDNAPAESFASSELGLKSSKNLPYGVSRRVTGLQAGPIIPVRINNRAFSSQNIWLESISPGFFIEEQSWIVGGNSTIEVAVEFHPPREQTRYDGYAVFAHMYGKISIRLFGTGSSADLATDESVDFGTLRLHSGGRRVFRIHNRGILGSHFELDIVQKSNEFALLEGDPFETQGFIGPGETISKEISCKCQSKIGADGEILVRWKKVPKGKTELFKVPIKLEIGYPEFKVHTTALDYTSTFIGINKTLSLIVLNEGNASCNWTGESDNQAVVMDKTSGLLLPGESDIIRVKYSPVDYGILDSSLSFNTDAGYFKVVCFGVVGVPFLKIMNETRMVDFGLVTVGKHHSQFLDIANSGKQRLEFELEWFEMSRDSVPLKHEEFEHFFVEPTHGIIQSGESFPLKVSVFPKDYAVVYQGKILLRGSSGEEHIFHVKAIGGQAIIKIKPPKPASASSIVSAQKLDQKTKQLIIPKERLTSPSHTTQQLLKTHIDTLYEVLGGLKSAEEEIKVSISPEQLLLKSVKSSSSKPSTPQALSSSHKRPDLEVGQGDDILAKLLASDMEEVAQAEKEIEMAMAKLDPTGLYSRITPLSRSRAPGTKSTTPDYGVLPPISGSRPPSRDYGGYKPGRRSTTSGESTDPLLHGGSRIGTPLSNKGHVSSPSSVSKGIGKSLPPIGSALDDGSAATKQSTSSLFSDPEADLVSKDFASRSSTPLTTKRNVVPPQKGLNSSAVRQQLLEQVVSRKGTPPSKPHSPLQPTVVPTDSVSTETKMMASANVTENSAQIEKMLQLAGKLGLDLESSADGIQTMESLKSTLVKFLDTTKNTMRTVKERILNESWVPNRELLHQALRKLQISRVAIEDMIFPVFREEAILEENFYSLELVCGGERSPNTLLFSIPNEGNIPFNYRILPKKDDCSFPEGAIAGLTNFFSLECDQGILKPGESVNIAVSFSALVTGSYRQGFVIKSGDEDILSFAVGAAVGNPILEFSASEIDFGLVGKGHSMEKQISIRNVGSFEGSWGADVDSDHSCFKAFPLVGKIDLGAFMYFNLTFSPPGEGSFNATVKLLWKEGPSLLKLIGSGGAPKLDFTYHSSEDKAFKGIDFGKCVLKARFEHAITVLNSGSMEAIIQLSHPNTCIYMDVRRNDLGEVRLAPGESTLLKVVYIPEHVEKLSNPIIFTLVNAKNTSQSIFVKGRSGTEIMEAEESLDFPNIPLDEWQQKNLKFKNSGTFDLPFKYEFDPASLVDDFLVDVEGSSNPQSIVAGKELVLSIKPIPTVAREIKGSLIATTTLNGVLKEFRFPFSFKIYAEEITALISEPVSVGRVMPGDKAQADQVIVNNSNKKIEYRAQILNADGSGQSLDWVLAEDNVAGIIKPNEQLIVTALFNAVKGRGDQWQNATLIIERFDQKSGEWKVFSEVALKGGLGEAMFVLEPESISFEEVAIGELHQAKFCFKNPGTAFCSYEILPNWRNESIFVIDAIATQLKGSIPSDNGFIEFTVTFKPDKEGYFDTELQVITPVVTKTIFISGTGQIPKLYLQNLPDVLDFKRLNFGTINEAEITILNDCRLDIVISGALAKDENGNTFSFLGCSPQSAKLKANENDYDRNGVTMTISCGQRLEVDENGLPKKDQFDGIIFGKQFTSTLSILGQTGGLLAQIPISFSFELLPLTLLSTSSDFEKIATLPCLPVVAFGKVGLEIGDVQYFMIYNPNDFQVQCDLHLDGSQFKISTNSVIINPGTYEDLEIEFLPLRNEDFPDGLPKNAVHEGKLTISPWISSYLSPIIVPISGTLSDVDAGLHIAPTADFGNVFKKRTVSKTLAIKNSSIRPIKWKLVLDKDYVDVFFFDPPSAGVLGPRSGMDLTLHFCPQIGVSYNTTAYLETGDDTYTISLSGSGVEPKLDMAGEMEKGLDFGIVGVTAPEFRDIPLKNGTQIPMRVRIKSDNPDFRPADEEVVILPGETHSVRVIFEPKDDNTAALQVANISVVLLEGSLEQPEDALADLSSNRRPASRAKEMETLNIFKLEGRGGNFEFEVEGSDVEELEEMDLDDVAQELAAAEISGRRQSRSSVQSLLQHSPQSSPRVGGSIEMTNIIIKFGKVEKLQKSRKAFDVENSGAAPLDFFAELMTGENIKESEFYWSKNKHFKFSVSPSQCNILPKSKVKIAVILEGAVDGDDTVDFVVKTKNLMHNRGIHTRLAATIFTQSEIENIKSYLRADENIDTKYDIIKQEERIAMGDLQLWKVLAPVLRISNLMAGQQLSYIAPIEPNVQSIDMHSFVVRPPAIPEPLVVKGKKFTNRISMGLDQQMKTNSNDEMDTKLVQKRDDAIDFLAKSNVEKLVQLEKKKKAM